MAKNKKWFIKVRGSYLPNTTKGAVTYIPFLAYLIFVLVVAFNDAATVAAALLVIFPNFVCAGVVMNWVASNKS
jgi:hypothetical protein